MNPCTCGGAKTYRAAPGGAACSSWCDSFKPIVASALPAGPTSSYWSWFQGWPLPSVEFYDTHGHIKFFLQKDVGLVTVGLFLSNRLGPSVSGGPVISPWTAVAVNTRIYLLACTFCSDYQLDKSWSLADISKQVDEVFLNQGWPP